MQQLTFFCNHCESKGRGRISPLCISLQKRQLDITGSNVTSFSGRKESQFHGTMQNEGWFRLQEIVVEPLVSSIPYRFSGVGVQRELLFCSFCSAVTQTQGFGHIG